MLIARGTDFYFAILLGFLMSGTGIVYLGEKRKGSIWFSLQIIAFLAVTCLQATIDIESRYLGLIIFSPWLIQLVQTATTYKDKFGDIDF